jgi:hypothetical protein
MSTHEFVFQAAQVAVETAMLLVTGVGCEHDFGEAARAYNGAPPRYVWVPGRTTGMQEQPATRDEQEIRALAVGDEYCEIDCWGKTYAQASAMRNNLLKAIHDITAADMKLQAIEWVRPGTGLNQAGQVCRVTVSIATVLAFDAFIRLDTLEEPEEGTVIPARIEGDIYATGDLDEAGELGLNVSTSDP